MFLIIDNYDSFVHNLARYFELAGVEDYEVIRNDAITIKGIKVKGPEAIILSPGPCTPKEAGICIKAIKEFGSSTPILGVCLGHQAIGEAYGAKTIEAHEHIHGKASSITHDATGLFEGIPSPLKVGRYHSLITKLPKNSKLKITATKEDDGTIMAMQHETHPVYGVQFHPESILTQHGQEIIKNFVEIANQFNHDRHCEKRSDEAIHLDCRAGLTASSQ